MREIEIKARVRDEHLLRSALQSRGIKLSRPIRQHDEVFAVPGAAPGMHCIWLRIRTEDNSRHTFTLKRSVTSKHDSIEHEVDFSGTDELRSIIGILGYVPFSDINKLRQKAKYGDFEVCLDNVDGLGLFIEIESMCEHYADVESVRAKLWRVLEDFGILRTDEESEGYDIMVKRLKT